MKRSTRTIEVIEMTKTEEYILWNTPAEERTVLGKKVKHWLTDDGNNDILLEGETTYLPIERVKQN
jgi:hypothetical protein